MTSRPAQPGQRPKPPRSLSGSGMLQRQAQQRSHLNNQLGTPGSSRNNVVDLTNEPSSSASPRPGVPSRAASGLRLEPLVELKVTATAAEAQHQPSSPWPVAPPPWPRGKPKLLFGYQNSSQDGTTIQSPGFADMTASSPNVAIPAPLPFPAKPLRRGPPARDRSSELANAIPAQKRDKVPKPYVMEVPSVAPSCPSKFNLDYFPWTGEHPEDKFSETIIRNGYFDKMQASSQETASGKQTVAPILKQQQSLRVLSTVFGNILIERRKNALVTSAPTFKPPPRVTLPDSKKETWLKDLANPSIPLRRLSRTIPHGIKNKLLLEQCMDKEVPMERAVWLAKCVGANEIRASKRTKGAPGAIMSGGEAKWIRDWTVCVEQFIESTIALCGELSHKLDGKSKLMYCIRLSAYLHSERLLDSAHYLDYILASLDGSHVAKLPVRLFIAGVHSTDLLQYRRTGRRYVAALCSRLQVMHESQDRDIFLPVIDKVGAIIKSILVSHPESFFSSTQWPHYKATIEASVSYIGSGAAQSLVMIDERHNCLRHGLSRKQALQGPRREIINLLDSTLKQPFNAEIGKACWKAMEPHVDLAQTVLEWATSAHRPGSTKIFVAVRLLRVWSRHGLDVNESALDFLTWACQYTTVSREALYHLYSELARSGHFLVSKYIHWLIARGGLRSLNDAAIDGPVTTRLLAELPLRDIPDSLLRLRKTLLHRASFSTDAETATVEHYWRQVESRLPSLSKMQIFSDVAPTEQETTKSIVALSRSVKDELGLRLRHLVKSCVVEVTSAKEHRTISIEDFALIRALLEEAGDIAILADVLKLVLGYSGSTTFILASCVDTIHVHRDSLTAIGAFTDLFETVVGRYRTLSMAHGSDVAPLLASLCELSATVAEARELYIELAKQIARSTHKATVEACSPVSDHVVEVLQKGDASCSDEIEKLMGSGSSMDHTTFVRLFEVLVSQIETLWAKQAIGGQRYSILLGRLKTFNPEAFSLKLTTWLDAVIQRAERPTIVHIFGPLISAECVTFGEVLKSCNALLQINISDKCRFLSDIALETLTLLFGSSQEDYISHIELYRLKIRRIHAQSAYEPAILDIIRHVVEMERPLVDNQPDAFFALCGERPFIDFLQHLVITRFNVITDLLVVPLAKSHDCRVLMRLRILLRSLLDLRTTQTSAADLEPASRIATIIGAATDLTLPFCQLALQSVFASDVPDKKILVGDESTPGSTAVQAFEKAIDQALDLGNTTWTSIIPALDVQISRHLFENAERKLVNGLLTTDRDEDARQKLFIIEATAFSMRGYRNASMAMLLLEKVNEAVKHVTSGDNEQQHRFETGGCSLSLITEVVSVLTADLDGVGQTGEIRAGFLVMLAGLHIFLKSKHLGTDGLRHMVFNTILSLADSLNEEARIRCVKQLLGHAPAEQSTPGPSMGTPAVHSVNFASTPSGAGMSPAQATFQIASAPSLSAATSATAAADPELCYALSFGRDKGTGIVLMQKGKMMPFQIKRWENLSEPTPIIGENDTSLSLRLFEARKN